MCWDWRGRISQLRQADAAIDNYDISFPVADAMLNERRRNHAHVIHQRINIYYNDKASIFEIIEYMRNSGISLIQWCGLLKWQCLHTQTYILLIAKAVKAWLFKSTRRYISVYQSVTTSIIKPACKFYLAWHTPHTYLSDNQNNNA